VPVCNRQTNALMGEAHKPEAPSKEITHRLR
jgi:hypothetical protein